MRRLAAFAPQDARWSPDGTRVYTSAPGLVIVDVATGRSRLLAPKKGRIEAYPAWSPDGRTIMFSLQRAPGRISGLVAVAPDGSGLHTLRRADVMEPRWSPDGQQIAYSRADRRTTSAGTSSSCGPTGRTHAAGPRNSFEIARADGHGKPLLIHGGDDPDWGP